MVGEKSDCARAHASESLYTCTFPPRAYIQYTQHAARNACITRGHGSLSLPRKNSSSASSARRALTHTYKYYSAHSRRVTALRSIGGVMTNQFLDERFLADRWQRRWSRTARAEGRPTTAAAAAVRQLVGGSQPISPMSRPRRSEARSAIAHALSSLG